MSVPEFLRRLIKSKDWIEKMNVEDLEMERLRIDNQVNLLSKEIERLEKEKKELFRQGVGKSEMEKMLLAEKIKDLDSEIKMRIRDYNRLMKQRRVLSNLIMIKKHEQRLKEKGIWDKIKSLDQDKLLQILSQIQFKEEMFDRKLDEIIESLERPYVQIKIDESTKEIMELWQKVEKAELSPEVAEEKLAVKIVEKEEEEKEQV